MDIDGKWYNLCPYYRNKDGVAKTHNIFWAQSAFREVDYTLRDYAKGVGIPDDMSSGLREVFHEALEEEVDGWLNKITWKEYYEQTLYYVDFANAIVPRVKKDKPYMYEGYVLKREHGAFEVNEIDEFSEWLTEEEYKELSDKQKRQYIFYRWNDPYGEYWIYRAIAERIWTLSDLFEDACSYDIGGSIYNGISDSQIRVFVDRS